MIALQLFAAICLAVPVWCAHDYVSFHGPATCLSQFDSQQQKCPEEDSG